MVKLATSFMAISALAQPVCAHVAGTSLPTEQIPVRNSEAGRQNDPHHSPTNAMQEPVLEEGHRAKQHSNQLEFFLAIDVPVERHVFGDGSACSEFAIRVFNGSSSVLPAPRLFRLRLFDSESSQVASWIVVSQIRQLGPGEEARIGVCEPSFPGSAITISVDFPVEGQNS